MLNVGDAPGSRPASDAHVVVASASRAVRVGEHRRQLACAPAARDAPQQLACGALAALIRAVAGTAACSVRRAAPAPVGRAAVLLAKAKGRRDALTQRASTLRQLPVLLQLLARADRATAAGHRGLWSGVPHRAAPHGRVARRQSAPG